MLRIRKSIELTINRLENLVGIVGGMDADTLQKIQCHRQQKLDCFIAKNSGKYFKYVPIHKKFKLICLLFLAEKSHIKNLTYSNAMVPYK